MADRDSESLIAFVRDLRGLLGSVVEEPQDLIYTHHRDDLARAWVELTNRGAFERLQEALQNPELDQELERLGLTGAQLEVKLKPFYFWLDKRISYEEWIRTPIRSRRRRKWFRRALKWANIPLGSLASIAGFAAFADPVKEIKDVFLEASEDRES